MPYPSGLPKAKHELLAPRLPPDGTSLNDQLGFESTATLFQALQGEVRKDLKRLGPVYTYADAPGQPLSRDLLVIGVADVSLSVVRRLVGDEDYIPDCLHKCTVGVKRADGDYRNRLKKEDVGNSTTFANFIRRLRKEGVVAILSRDKLNRFAIINPSTGSDSTSDFVADDFAVTCYVGDVNEVKDFLTQGLSGPPAPAPEPTYEPESEGLWQPPSEPAVASEGLWQPPSQDQENTDSAFSWKPPSGEDAEESFDFGSGTNGAASWEPESADTSNKRKRDDEESEFHTNRGAAAADEFYSKLTRNLDTRAASRIYHMRAFNGWVKATQIQELDPKTKQLGKKANGPLRILDLACGKGGDLGKWVLQHRGIENYVGSDVARGSLRDAAIRVRQMRQKLKRCTFTCADLGADVPGRLKSAKHKHMQKLLTWSLQDEAENASGSPEFKMVRGGGISQEDRFDVVSIQFAIHYMMQTRKRARRFFQTVSELLEVGGNLIATTIDARVVVGHLMNLGLDLHFDTPATKEQDPVVAVGAGACRIRFTPEIVKKIFQQSSSSPTDENLFGLEYTFTLVEGSDHAAGVGDAVNLPEWLTPIPVLEALGKEVGLELEYAQNFHEFYAARKDPNTSAAAHSSLYNMKVLNRTGSISSDEWEISRLYAAIKFKKVRESTMTLEDSDEEEEDEEEDIEIDPVLKVKLMPMAMMKAKKAFGAGAWQDLSSDEKTRLTEIELRKLAGKS